MVWFLREDSLETIVDQLADRAQAVEDHGADLALQAGLVLHEADEDLASLELVGDLEPVEVVGRHPLLVGLVAEGEPLVVSRAVEVARRQLVALLGAQSCHAHLPAGHEVRVARVELCDLLEQLAGQFELTASDGAERLVPQQISFEQRGVVVGHPCHRPRVGGADVDAQQLRC